MVQHLPSSIQPLKAPEHELWGGVTSSSPIAGNEPHPRPPESETLQVGGGDSDLYFTSPPGDPGACSSLSVTALRHNGLSLHRCPRIFLVTDIKYDSCKILAAEYICLFNCMQNACQEGFQGLFLQRLPSLLHLLNPSLWRLHMSSIQVPTLQGILKASTTPALLT